MAAQRRSRKRIKIIRRQVFARDRFSRFQLIVFSAIFAAIGGYLLLRSFAATCTSVTYTAPSGSSNSVTYTFDRGYTCDQFANGDWFVVPDNPGGTVTITDITPAMIPGRHGVDVNPIIPSSVPSGNPNNYNRFDDRLTGYQAPTITFPYTARGGESIVKYVSNNPSGACGDGCAIFAAVLTVLDSAPASPSTTFRPPYYGTYKPLISTNSLQTQHLLRLPSVNNKITLADAMARTRHQRLDYSPSSLHGGAPFEPLDAYPPDGQTWGGDVHKKDTELIYWLHSDNACSTPPCSAAQDLAAKMPVLIGYVQYGIDQWGALKGGVSFYRGGGGNGAGKLLLTAFAAAMLDNQEIKADLINSDLDDFHETNSIYRGNEGRALWGQPVSPNPEDRYWDALGGPSNFSGRDPYQQIDGGSQPGVGYQRSTAAPLMYTGLILRMMPAMQAVWPHNNATMIMDYADRIANVGSWTIPDSCAPKSGTYRVDYGPNGSGGCIAGSGRVPANHGLIRNGEGTGARDSAFSKLMWDTYRTQFETDPTPPPPPPPPCPPGDVNGDCRVTVTDLSILLTNWGSTTNVVCDLNTNGIVDIFDLSILLSNYGR
jgi:hypothetical protein